ncbi:MAG: hypothetical protein LBH35_00150 [Treponema sp.]|nr:hypothetical protein [Treponema sp.]
MTLRNSDGNAGSAEGKARSLFVSVSDDGRGFPDLRDSGFPAQPVRIKFDASPAGVPDCLGLRSMYERYAILKGSLTVESEQGEGTIICLEAPLKGGSDE